MKKQPQTFFEATEEANRLAKEIFHMAFPWFVPFANWLNKKFSAIL